MPRKRQLVFVNLEDPTDRLGGTIPLGGQREVAEAFARFNTAPDGSPPRASGTVLYYGPGIWVELMSTERQVRQALVTCYDEELAWPVLRGICDATGWKLQDMESGQMFGV